tara:strand:- start:1054 stop:1374 length:321 start_codon:yes stop_codon:yes gene_type:complete
MSGHPKYVIKQYTLDKIKELNEKLDTSDFNIKLSKDPSKKIDVFLREKIIATIGDINLLDFPSFVEERGIEFANKRRAAFYNRFKRLPDIQDGKITNMFWSRYLLW